MNNNQTVTYKIMDIDDLHPFILNNFNRFQETNCVMYKENGKYNYKADHFIDEWDDIKKKLVIQSLRNCIKYGGFVIGAFVENDLIGFANVEGQFFGRKKEYLELPYIHVSNEFRNKGIGRKMFELCCLRAKELGAKKLYIGAHPSQETQSFYRSVGCTYAEEINQDIYNREPLDIQLEITL